MDDLHSAVDVREVPLERVGVSQLALPVRIRQKHDGYQHVLGSADLFVEVPASVRGTHLSRFVELLTEWADKPVSSHDFKHLLSEARKRAGSVSAEAGLSFKYFLQREAPVSRRAGYLDFDCEFRGRMDERGFDFRLGAQVPVTTVCPCSKAIADLGAHNQRALVRTQIRYAEHVFVWLEDLIELVEGQASCPVFPVLKRVDEKFVTEAAYANPKFVEDVVRDVVLQLQRVEGIRWFSVECESQESIHNHNAFASATLSLARLASKLPGDGELGGGEVDLAALPAPTST